MTTVFSDGSFLVADKRASVTYKAFDANAPRLTKEFSTTSHEHSKIYIPKGKITCWSSKEQAHKEVAAIAFAGSTHFAEACINSAEAGIDMFRVFQVARNFDKEGGSFVAICKDGTTVKQTMSPNGAVHVYMNKKGSVMGCGSGNHEISSALELIPRSKIRLMDAFVYAVHCDKNSNNRFDLFSLKENKLMKDLRISPIALSRAIKNMESHIDLTRCLK